MPDDSTTPEKHPAVDAKSEQHRSENKENLPRTRIKVEIEQTGTPNGKKYNWPMWLILIIIFILSVLFILSPAKIIGLFTQIYQLVSWIWSSSP